MVLSTTLDELIARYPNLFEEVDLITGTSIGGIFALALASGKMNPEDCTKLLLDNAEKIFPGSFFRNLFKWTGPKYSNEGLQSLMKKVFGECKLKDIPKNILIPSYHMRNTGMGTAQIAVVHNFTTSEGATSAFANELARDVAMQTSAAPTIFPEFNEHVDGGVWANNPSLVAVTHALQSGVKFEDIVVLSLGTGQFNHTMQKGNHGYIQWLKSGDIIDVFMNGNAQHTDRCCAILMQKRFHRIQPHLDKNVELDAASEVKDLQSTAVTNVRSVLDQQEFGIFMRDIWRTASPTLASVPRPSHAEASISLLSSVAPSFDHSLHRMQIVARPRVSKGMGVRKVVVDHLPPDDLQQTL